MREKTKLALREDAETIFQAAVDRVMPERLFSYCLSLEGSALGASDGQMTRKYDLSQFEHIVIAAFGKASLPMAASLVSLLGERVSQGLVVTKASEDGRPLQLAPQVEKVFAAQSVRVIEAGHPVPDQRSVMAGKEMLTLASQVRDWEMHGSKTLVCVLISGGGSALLSAPVKGLSPEDTADVTRLLLACGATIHEINTVRKHLSAIKGGFLARAFSPAQTLSLVLSDVMGDDLDVIASGPTVPDMSTWQDVKAIFDRFGLFDALPEAVVRATHEGLSGLRPETPKPGDTIFDSCSTMLVGTNYHAILEAERTSRALGYNTLVIGTRISGEAREIGKIFSGIAQDIMLHELPVAVPACIIAGGETTVTLRGKGRGGRNQEMALSVLREFSHFPRALCSRLKGVVFLSAGTDGNDGPTDAAGAFADAEAIGRAQALDLNPSCFLAENDSYAFFEKADGFFKTGPTGTNVCDIQILIVR
ncbi:putative glycerate kinase [uncultured spirochete]|uniref:Putative glycerate kinase n=1 Tax=uncultured spirochete TaxID=156406 RepID=A0A3P3XNI6_9SPIR|nr:putative glycerate kinase [uncultured spirochete]